MAVSSSQIFTQINVLGHLPPQETYTIHQLYTALVTPECAAACEAAKVEDVAFPLFNYPPQKPLPPYLHSGLLDAQIINLDEPQEDFTFLSFDTSKLPPSVRAADSAFRSKASDDESTCSSPFELVTHRSATEASDDESSRLSPFEFVDLKSALEASDDQSSQPSPLKSTAAQTAQTLCHLLLIDHQAEPLTVDEKPAQKYKLELTTYSLLLSPEDLALLIASGKEGLSHELLINLPLEQGERVTPSSISLQIATYENEEEDEDDFD